MKSLLTDPDLVVRGPVRLVITVVVFLALSASEQAFFILQSLSAAFLLITRLFRFSFLSLPPA